MDKVTHIVTLWVEEQGVCSTCASGKCSVILVQRA